MWGNHGHLGPFPEDDEAPRFMKIALLLGFMSAGCRLKGVPAPVRGASVNRFVTV